MITGSTATEIAMGASEATFNMDEAELRNRVGRWMGDQTDLALNTYRTLYPKAPPSERYFLIGSYLRTTRMAVDQAELRLKKSGRAGVRLLLQVAHTGFRRPLWQSAHYRDPLRFPQHRQSL